MFTKLFSGLIALVITFSMAGWEQIADSSANSATATREDWRVLMEEITLVQVLSESYARVETVCAGMG
jgi:hypothetical protein